MTGLPNAGRLADGSSPATPDDLFARLRQLGIAVTTVQHRPVFTVEEARAHRGDLPGIHTKSLFLRDKKSRNQGHIINVSSVVGSLPSQGVALYSATKSFIDTLTSSLYRELRGTDVHISVVKPGAVATPFFDSAASKINGQPIPAKRLAIQPEMVAGRIMALIRRPRRMT